MLTVAGKLHKSIGCAACRAGFSSIVSRAPRRLPCLSGPSARFATDAASVSVDIGLRKRWEKRAQSMGLRNNRPGRWADNRRDDVDVEANVVPPSELSHTVEQMYGEYKRSGRVFRHDFDIVLAKIRSKEKVSPADAVFLIRACGLAMGEEYPEERTKLVHTLWRQLEKQDVKFDVSHYNAMLLVYLENEHQFNPEEFLEMLGSKGVEPNRITYQRLISRYCQEKKMDQAGYVKLLKFTGFSQNPNVGLGE